MNRAKSVFVIIILLLSLSFLLIACGDKDSSTTPSSHSGSEQPDDTPKPTPAITKTKIIKPNRDTTTFIYNGREQEYRIEENEAYIVQGNIQKDAGRYEVIITLSDTSKYVWKDGSSRPIKYNFEIEKANLSLRAEDKTSVYGESIENLSYTIDQGRIYGGEISPILTCDINSLTECGTYDINIDPIDNNNYDIHYTNGFYTITRATNTWTTPFEVEENHTYNGEPLTIGEDYYEPVARFGEVTYLFYDSASNLLESAPVDIGIYYVEAIVYETTNYTYLTSGKKQIQIV